MKARIRGSLIRSFMCTFTLCGIFLVQTNASQAAGVYLNFDNFSSNQGAGTAPKGSSDWQYSSGVTNNFPSNSESFGSSFITRSTLPDGKHWLFTNAADFRGICYDHIGVDTYGFLDITPGGHSGKALRHTITGGLPISSSSGACPNSPAGTPLYNRESYKGSSQVYTGGDIGISYLYFHRITETGLGAQRVTTPYSVVAGANRMSAYIYLPPGTSNGIGGFNNPVLQTYEMGLFVNGASTGYHHYFNYYTRGGGWTKIQVEETTNGDNGGNGTTRYIPGMIKGDGLSTGSVSQGLWQFYMTTQPYSGIATPPYEIKIDDIAFDNDSYIPQNNETISNIAVLFRDSDKTWEISFNDKYKSANAYSTYQIYYSLSGPITNENLGSASPVNVIADSRFAIAARTDGKVQKWWPYFQGVWAPFSLSTSDTNRLSNGQTVYFAVKDISQVAGNSTTPVSQIISVYPYDSGVKGGRDYAKYPTEFNYTKDNAALPNIKRISFTIPAKSQTLPASNLHAL